MADCTHLDQVRDVQPRTPGGCQECLATGDQWVHLRECHATAHFHADGHPLVRSFERGEAWAWCYLDEIVLQPAPSPYPA